MKSCLLRGPESFPAVRLQFRNGSQPERDLLRIDKKFKNDFRRCLDVYLLHDGDRCKRN
jgi:hypothetical protein